LSEELRADPSAYMGKYGISPEDLTKMQAALGTPDAKNSDLDTAIIASKTTNNRAVGNIAGETGNVNLGDIRINTSGNNQNDQKKPAPDTAGTHNITNHRQIGNITGTVGGDVIVGDQTYYINLTHSDIQDQVMQDIAAGKLAPNTEAGWDYHKLSDSKKEDIKNKMRDALDKQKAEYMKSMPALIEKDYTLEQRKSEDPEMRAKIQADIAAAAERFLKKLQAGQLPLFERLVKGGDADSPVSDNLFIGGNGKLMQWSVSQGEVTKDYGGILSGDIEAMVQTSDKKYLFLADNEGC
jgi:hypothetical protein